MTEIVLVSINRLIMVVERDVVSARGVSTSAPSILVALSSEIQIIEKSFRRGLFRHGMVGPATVFMVEVS